MDETDLLLESIRLPFPGVLGVDPRPVLFIGMGSHPEFIGCPDQIWHMETQMTFAGIWDLAAKTETRKIFGTEYRRYRGTLRTVRYGDRNASGQVYCKDGFAIFYSIALW